MAEQHGQAAALENDHTQVTYAELLVSVNALAVALQSKDPTPGSRVGLCAEQSLEYQVSMLAILAAGKIPVPLSPYGSTENLHQMLNDTQCSTLLVDEIGQKKINADDDFAILFSQLEGLVLTYRGQTPERHATGNTSSTTQEA
ncbi:AMP-binding protein [Pollutimonas harenae]|nr:AMP-binding protein [Pollutimonas harenae]